MESDLVTVGVREAEGAAKGPIDRRWHGWVAVRDKRVVHVLDVGGVELNGYFDSMLVADPMSVPVRASRSAIAIGAVSNTTA